MTVDLSMALNNKNSMTWILGLSAYYHDSAACLIRDGEIHAAAQEERFNRKKQFTGFPAQTIRYRLREADIPLTDVSAEGLSRKNLNNLGLKNYLEYNP